MSLLRLVDNVHAELDVVAAGTVARMAAELPSYHGLTAPDLEPLVRHNLEAALRAIRLGPDAPADERDDHRAAGRLRAEQGVAVEDMLHGWRIGTEEVRRHARTVAQRLRLPTSALLEFTDRALAWTDRAMVESAVAHRGVEMERARHEQHHRANLVRSVLFGAPAASDLRPQAIAYGIDPSARYIPFRAGVPAGMEVRALERRLGIADFIRPRASMAALIDGDLAGFATRLPQDLPGEPPLIVGIGPASTLDGLAPGYTLASRALRTATALAMPGLWTLPALGLLPAVLDDDEVGAPLVAAIVDRVRTTGNGTVLLDTVTRYLTNDRRLDVTARDLHVHVNTVRYRLRQFEALTDRNLARTADLVAVWWALRRAGATM